MDLEDISHHLHQTSPQLESCSCEREPSLFQRCKKHLRLPRRNGPLSHTGYRYPNLRVVRHHRFRFTEEHGKMWYMGFVSMGRTG